MNMIKFFNKLSVLPKWLLIWVAIFLAGAVVFSGLMGFYQMNYKDKIYLGVRVDGLSLAGKNRAQAKALIQAKVDRLADQGAEFVYRDNSLIAKPIVSTGSETGLAYELWLYDIEGIVDELYSRGRQGGWLENISDQVGLMIWGSGNRVSYDLKEAEMDKILREYFSEWESPGKDAELMFKNYRVEISEEESGLVFDYSRGMEKLRQNLERIESQKIEMTLVVDEPEVSKTEAEFLVEKAEDILDLAPLTISFKKPEDYQGRKYLNQTEWYINRGDLIEWLEIGMSEEGEALLRVDRQVAGEYLGQVAEGIDTPANDAKFDIKDGRVVEWQSSTDGFVVNISETINQLERELIQKGKNKVELVLSIDKSKITNENVNDLGINELIGVGESNFAGSPVNRRHNIAVGVEALNGLLIKPEEEFSLLAALGEIDAAAGYRPELVIKQGGTVPEYGGGLCQIGTTLFRSVINTGLEITQRRNHSYRVGYYEPAGTDATIYDPWPDFRFLNDTGNYLLLQTRTEGDRAIFEFWGTSDGREVATTTPVIYNIVAAGEPEYIPSTELQPGEKRRIETAHSGADAYFKRMIVWPEDSGREAVEETFNSHYVPWREKWLVGATSTEEVVE